MEAEPEPAADSGDDTELLADLGLLPDAETEAETELELAQETKSDRLFAGNYRSTF